MNLQAFCQDPWKSSHPAYGDAVFNIRPAPEFATAEVLVASLYRAIGFKDVAERDVPVAGREFDKLTQRAKLPAGIAPRVSGAAWRSILHGVLESPKQPNQSAKRFLQLSPVVPDVALYSGSARLSGNSWNPGALIQRMIRLGVPTEAEANKLWATLFTALGVDEYDDIWARWLQEEFGLWQSTKTSWQLVSLAVSESLPVSEQDGLSYPAKRFVADLRAVIGAKALMTRRQWVSLLEAVLRVGAVAHVLWLCDVNDRTWRVVRAVMDGLEAPSSAFIGSSVVSAGSPLLAYGNPAVPIIRDLASRYLVARIGLNLTLWHLEELGVSLPAMNSCQRLAQLLGHVGANREPLKQRGLLTQFVAIRDQEARAVACKKGIGSNLVEFGRHVLGQRQTASESLRGYDQGYLLRKKGDYASAPWVVSLGPVAVLALAHCCLHEGAGPRSVNRLCQHLAEYGIEVDGDDLASNDLGRKLRMLGLVLDSPDAEGGMLLVPPFEAEAVAEEGTTE
jgi:hypothetical protein